MANGFVARLVGNHKNGCECGRCISRPEELSEYFLVVEGVPKYNGVIAVDSINAAYELRRKVAREYYASQFAINPPAVKVTSFVEVSDHGDEL
jgi:hypothetical protein